MTRAACHCGNSVSRVAAWSLPTKSGIRPCAPGGAAPAVSSRVQMCSRTACLAPVLNGGVTAAWSLCLGHEGEYAVGDVLDGGFVPPRVQLADRAEDDGQARSAPGLFQRVNGRMQGGGGFVELALPQAGQRQVAEHQRAGLL